MNRIQNLTQFTAEINHVVDEFARVPGYSDAQAKVARLRDGFISVAKDILECVPSDSVPGELALEGLLGNGYLVIATTVRAWSARAAA